MHERQDQNQRGRGRGGESAARGGRPFNSHRDAHLSQNQRPTFPSPHDQSFGLYNQATAPPSPVGTGSNLRFPATHQPALIKQPTSYSTSAHPVESPVILRYIPPDHQQRFDQPVRPHSFALPIRAGRVKFTKTDERHRAYRHTTVALLSRQFLSRATTVFQLR